MDSWQILAPNQIGKINTTENLEKLDDVKVKITKCYVSKSDVASFTGAQKREYPFIPCDIAVGQVVETLKDSDFIKKGSKVYLSKSGANGYLRDFAVVPEDSMHVLPSTVTESDALYVNHIAIALTVIDKIGIDKGQHVAIVGASVLANVIAQLVMYYQAVPIVIDQYDENLERARKTNVYYTLKSDKSLENEILSITGGRKCSKIIYITDSEISLDVIDKLACYGADVGVTGISETKAKLSSNIAFNKELNVKFIKTGSDNTMAAINLLAQKAIILKHFKLPIYKFEYVSKHFENAVAKMQNGDAFTAFIVDLL